MTKKKIEPTVCTQCCGFGMHYMGEHTPMGLLDAQDGLPTIACSSCGANYNPIQEEKKKPKFKILKQETIDDITIMVTKTTYFYDILINGEESKLKEIKKKLKLDSHIISSAIGGESIIVVDTVDMEEMRTAVDIFNDTIEKLRKIYEC